jgi:hypothetical protein
MSGQICKRVERFETSGQICKRVDRFVNEWGDLYTSGERFLNEWTDL